MIELAPVVFAEAEHDAVAAEIVDRLAEEVVTMIRVTLERLELTDEPVDVALGGGLMQSGDPRLIGAVEGRSGPRSRPPRRVHVTSSPPIVGAALLGLDELGAGAGAQERLRASSADVFANVETPQSRDGRSATGKESMMKRLLVSGAGGRPRGDRVRRATTTSSSKGGSTSVTISNEQGTTWTCGFNPFNANVNFLSFGTVYEELTFVERPEERRDDELARLELRVEQRQQDADVHDPARRQVERRQAVHRGRRRSSPSTC